MKVKHLIKELQKVNPEYEVIILIGKTVIADSYSVAIDDEIQVATLHNPYYNSGYLNSDDTPEPLPEKLEVAK